VSPRAIKGGIIALIAFGLTSFKYMVEITRVKTEADIIGIRDLQALNLKQNITAEEASSQGFLTAAYTIEYLQQMNSFSPSIIAKDGDKVVGYSLVSTKETKNENFRYKLNFIIYGFAFKSHFMKIELMTRLQK
jgi:predicted RecB family nuclease